MADTNKTEKATQKKRRDEQKKGNIFQSKDITNALSFILLIFIINLLSEPALDYIKSIMTEGFSQFGARDDIGIFDASSIIRKTMFGALVFIVPVGFVAAATGILFTGIQTRFMFKGERMKPKFSKLNPVNGFKRLISIKSIVELLKGLFKVVIIAVVVYTTIVDSLDESFQTMNGDVGAALFFIGGVIYKIAMSISIYLGLFAVVDYVYQWFTYEKEIMMTRQEIKDEFKQTEGDPQIKSRIKDVQRRMAQMRMMKQVASADVVIKNPTHFAVALKYDTQKHRAPIVVAKGQDFLALKIIEEAEKHGVYVTENKPLARALYDAAELDRQIPEEFFKPIADILAFLYKLRKTKAKNNRR